MSDAQYQPECRCHYCTQIRSAGTLAGAAQGMNVDHDPAKSLLKPLPPSEKAELQVSLLNEIGLTLTAVAERLKPIERIDTIEGMILDLAQRLYGRLEGIETTLIKEFINAKQSRDSDYALDDRRWEVMHDRVQAIESQLTAVAKEQVAQAETLKTYKLSLEGIQGLLVELEHSLDVIAEVQANSYDAVVTKFMHIEKRLAQIELRISHIGAQLTVLAQENPRKAGKRKGVKR